MEEIGFHEHGRYFAHPDTKHIIEFPPGPLSVGQEPVKQIKKIKLTTGILRVISPTDCVKDRLAGFYFWGDQQSLTQAILVSRNNRINLEEFKIYRDKLSSNKERPQRGKRVSSIQDEI